MAIEDADVVDIVSTNVERNEVILTISDHLPWVDSAAHQRLLQTKLNVYLQFVKGKELERSYPGTEGRTVVFRLVSKFRPDAEGRSFIEKAGAILRSAGIVLRADIQVEA